MALWEGVGVPPCSGGQFRAALGQLNAGLSCHPGIADLALQVTISLLVWEGVIRSRISPGSQKQRSSRRKTRPGVLAIRMWEQRQQIKVCQEPGLGERNSLQRTLRDCWSLEGLGRKMKEQQKE